MSTEGKPFNKSTMPPPPPTLRPDSKFKPFSLTLANNALLSGISYIPPHEHESSSPGTTSSSISAPGKPLLVLVHGGKCTPFHFDISSQHTYSTLSMPVVAIHRPGYGESTSFLPLRQSEHGEGQESGETFYHIETAQWMHELILPALWDEFGVKNECTGVVVAGHSMGGIQAVVTAGLYCREVAVKKRPGYRLKGIVVSGMGFRFVPRAEVSDGFLEEEPLPDEIFYNPGVMERLMLGDRALDLCEAEIYPKVDLMDVAMPRAELLSLLAWWPVHWREYTAECTVPVLYGLGEHDWLWETSEGHVAEMRSAFKKCKRFEGVGAPHCIEWSRVGGDWVKRVGNWAVELVSSGNER